MKRIFIAIVGGTVVLIGIAMLVLPGPAIVVIPAGVAILATEFIWARRWLERGKEILTQWKAGRASGLSFWAALKQAFARAAKPKLLVSHLNCPAGSPANPPSPARNRSL